MDRSSPHQSHDTAQQPCSCHVFFVVITVTTGLSIHDKNPWRDLFIRSRAICNTALAESREPCKMSTRVRPRRHNDLRGGRRATQDVGSGFIVERARTIEHHREIRTCSLQLLRNSYCTVAPEEVLASDSVRYAYLQKK